jgi:2-oxopent-4-enoate/cis-2-oxohex-4-enoate hydratase
MQEASIHELGDELYTLLRERRTRRPLTDAHAAMSIDDAYRISQRMLSRRLADGERVVGKKIGVTSEAVQRMLGVHQPDFGFLTDAMHFEAGRDLPIGELLIQPRAEAEIAFVLRSDLRGPGITPEHVLAATEAVYPCFEIVDSRIDDWRIKIGDTVADNASCGLFVLAREGVDPRRVDLTGCRVDVHKNGKFLSTGVGAASLGSPLVAVAWLANTLGAYGLGLQAGEIILSGSLVPLEPVQAGDTMRASIAGLGELAVRFT